MPNITFYVPQYIADKVKKEENQSALVSRLLANHYAAFPQPFGSNKEQDKNDEDSEEE